MAEAARKKHEKLPLMDEVQELIEKERTLLNLKLLEQKNEADEWKSKYDSLVEKVGNGVVDETRHQPLESAAEIEEKGGEIKKISAAQDIHHLLHDRAYPWVLDLSGVQMEKLLFSKVSKVVFGARNSFEEITTAVFRRCGLTDDYSNALMTTLRSPRLQAVDLSHNELGDVFFLQLQSALKDRRITPEYILLDGNMPLSASGKNFSSILEMLTEQTWGLTVSLQDFVDVSVLLNHQAAQQKKTAASRRELNHDYKETVKQPMFMWEFLRLFNSKLDPASAAPATKAQMKKASKGAVFGRFNGLHKMTVFGLKYCQLGRRSIPVLENTLRYLAASLTDLDLSFGYVGFSGAQMLQRILAAKECQLVRLGLIGNAVGDAGLSVLGQGLKLNKSLVCLDLRSNGISELGLRALTKPLCRNIIIAEIDLRGNSIGQDAVCELNQTLKDNGSHVSIRFDQVLDTPPIAAVASPSPAAAPSQQLASALTLGENFHDFPHKVRVLGSVGKATRLYSIDWTSINLNHPDKYGSPLVLQWSWRAVPVGTYLSTSSMLQHPIATAAAANIGTSSSNSIEDVVDDRSSKHHNRGGRRDGRDNAAYLQLGSAYGVYWEVRLVYNHHDLYVKREPATSSSCVARRMLEPKTDWTTCSTVLQDLPLKASIEVFLVCERPSAVDSSHNAGADESFIAFEGMGLTLHHLPPTDSHCLGGDASNMRKEHALAQNNYGINDTMRTIPLLKNMRVLRKLRWHHLCQEGYLKWDSRLVSYLVPSDVTGRARTVVEVAKAADIDLGGDAPDVTTDLPPHHQSLGYHWAVVIIGAEGKYRVAGEGAVFNAAAAEATATAEAAGVGFTANLSKQQPLGLGEVKEPAHKSEAMARLEVWKMKEFRADLSDLHLDDVILLMGRPASNQSNYPLTILNRCSVDVHKFTVNTNSYCVKATADAGEGGVRGEIEEEQFKVADSFAVDSDSTSFYSTHDDRSCILPL